MTFSNKIDAILSVGISLHESQIHNWALTQVQSLEIVEKFDAEKIALAGGDVMETINGQIGFSGASWYSDQGEDEIDSDFIKRSITEAREYVAKYPAADGIYFILIPW